MSVESLIAGLGMEDALRRAEAYHAAGADGLVIHSRKIALFDIVEEVPSMSDPGLIVEAFKRISEKYNVTAIMNVVEPSVMAHALLCKTMGYKGPSPGAAMSSLDKTRMRRAFSDGIGPGTGPMFGEIESEERLIHFCEEAGFPIVLKPTNLMGSMFISRNRNRKELLDNYRAMVPALARYLDECGRGEEGAPVQAESLLEGSNHSMDCLVDDAGNVRTAPMGIVTPYPDRCGTLVGNRLNGRLEALKCYKRHMVKTPAGKGVGPAEKGFLPPVGIELYGENIEELTKNTDRISSWNDIYMLS